MRRLMRILDLIDWLSDSSGKVFSLLLPALALVMGFEVIARYVFNNPTVWGYELSMFLFGASAILGGAYALRWRAHVNVDIFTSRISPRKRAVLDLVTSVVFFAFVGTLLWKGYTFAAKSVAGLEHTDTLWSPPIYYFKITLPVGAALILLQGVADQIRNLIAAIRGVNENDA